MNIFVRGTFAPIISFWSPRGKNLFLVEKDSRLMLIVVEEPSRVIWRRREPLGGIENQGGI